METSEFAVIAGAALSLLAMVVPGFKTWYEKLGSEQKQLVMIGALAAVVAGRFGLGCVGKDAAFVCSWDGAYEALAAWVLAVVANAGVYKATNYLARR